MIEKKLMLYVLVLSGKSTDSLFTRYRIDDQDAETASLELEQEYNASRVSLRAHTRGFRIHLTELSGVVAVAEDE